MTCSPLEAWVIASFGAAIGGLVIGFLAGASRRD